MNKCSEPVNLFGIVYLVLGALAAIMVAFALLGLLFSLIRPKDKITNKLGEGVYHDTNYDQNVDFNPYQ